MASSLTVGIDPAKRNFTAAFLGEEGRPGPADEFTMDRAGFEALGLAIQERRAPDQRVVVGVEASAALDDNLLAWLLEQRSALGLRVIRLDPGQVARFSGARPVRGKTDRADARKIVRFTATYADELDGFEADPRNVTMGRLVRERDGLVSERTALKNRLHDRVVVQFPELTELFDDPSAALARTVLRVAPTAAHALRRRRATLARLRPEGSRTQPLGEARAERLLALARRSIASATSQDDAEALIHLLDQLELLSRRITRIEARLTEFAAQAAPAAAAGGTAAAANPVPLQIRRLCAIRGIGTVGAASIVLRSGGLGRFTGSKALAAQLGACPDRCQTGRSFDRGRLTSRGDRAARSMLYMLAQGASQFDPALAFHK